MTSEGWLASWAARHVAPWALLVALLLTAFGYWSYTADDGFIHLTFSRNLAETGTFTFSGGEAVNGTTSPLWNLILAVPAWLGLSPLVAVKVYGYVFTVIAVVSASWLGSRLGSPTAGWLAGLVLCCDPWLLRWAVSGLETSLVVALVLIALALLHEERTSSGCAVAGFLPLARPEAALFVMLYALVLLATRSRREVVRGWVLLALPGALWAVYAWFAFGGIVANTVRSKTLNYTDGFVDRLVAIAKIGVVGHGLLLAVAALVTVGLLLRRSWRDLPGGAVGALLIAWPPLLVLGFVVSGSAAVSRYYLPGTAVAALVATVWLARQSPWLRYGVPLASCALSLVFGVVFIRPGVREYAEHFNKAAVEITDRLNELAAEGDVVAARDIGYLGYYNRSGYTILDLAGLVTPEMLEKDDARDAHVLRRQPRFIVERGKVENAVAANAPLEKLGIDAFAEAGALHFEVAAYLGRPGLNAEKPEWYTLYSVDRARMERVLELAGFPD